MATLLGSLICATTASAQRSDGAFQLGLDTTLFSYSSATIENDANSQEVETSTTRWGIRESVALELGYGVGDMVVVGALIALGGASQTTEPEGGAEVESSEFSATVGPKIDVMFAPGAAVRPYVGLMVGVETASQESGAGTETSLTLFNLMGRVGLRCFAASAFSIDPALMITWGTGGGEIESPLGTTVDINASGFSVAIALGVSGWL